MPRALFAILFAIGLAAAAPAQAQPPSTRDGVPAAEASTVDLSRYGFSPELEIRVWCQEVFAYMAQTGTSGLVVGPRSAEDTQYILDWAQQKIEEEAVALGIPPEVLAAFRSEQRTEIAGHFAMFLETRNLDDLKVIPGFCYTIDFDPAELFADDGLLDPVQAADEEWRFNLGCRAAMRHMTREDLFETYGDRMRGQNVFIVANNALRAAAPGRGLSPEQLEAEIKRVEGEVVLDYQTHWPNRTDLLSFGVGPCLSIGYGDETSVDVALKPNTIYDLWCYGALIEHRIDGTLDDAGQGRAAQALKILQDRIMGDHVFNGGTPFHVAGWLDAYRESVPRQFSDPSADVGTLTALRDDCYRRAVLPGDRIVLPEFVEAVWRNYALNYFIAANLFADREALVRTSDGLSEWIGQEYDLQGFSLGERVDFARRIADDSRPAFEKYAATRDPSVLPHSLDKCLAWSP